MVVVTTVMDRMTSWKLDQAKNWYAIQSPNGLSRIRCKKAFKLFSFAKTISTAKEDDKICNMETQVKKLLKYARPCLKHLTISITSNTKMIINHRRMETR